MVGKIYQIPTKKGYAKVRLDKGKTWQEVYGKRCRKCKQHFKESELYTTMDNDTCHFQHVDCKHPKKIEEELIFPAAKQDKPAKKRNTKK